MSSFRLSNINLQIDPNIPLHPYHKILKIEIQLKNKIITVQTQQPAEIINQHSLTWNESLDIPAKFQQKYQFQIVNKDHQYPLYNPENMDANIQGEIVIQKTEGNYTSWQATANHKKIGFLFANVHFITKAGTTKDISNLEHNLSFFGNSMPVRNNSIAITSLYANFPKFAFLEKIRVYLEFQIGGVTEKSAIKRLQHHQYRSFQTVQISQNSQNTTKLTVTAIVFDALLNTATKIGTGGTNLVLNSLEEDLSQSQLNERVKLERIFFYDEDGEEMGWTSFKYIQTKNELLDPRFFLQDKFSTIGDINFKPLRNSHLSVPQPINRSLIMSPLETNNRIFIPKSKRFQDPAKRKMNQRIGLGHGSMDIKDGSATDVYKFTSLGYGRKILPVERDHTIPGPGRYQLPLLFDRFK